jgi:hypothetical protein
MQSSFPSYLPSARIRMRSSPFPCFLQSCCPKKKPHHIAAADSPPNPHNRELGWVMVMHVCSCWRQVVCADQTLWARLKFHMGGWRIYEMLQRAQSAPVSCREISSPPMFVGGIDPDIVDSVITSHIHYIRKLDLHFYSRARIMKVINSLCFGTPVLKTLYLDFNSPRGSDPLPRCSASVAHSSTYVKRLPSQPLQQYIRSFGYASI